MKPNRALRSARLNAGLTQEELADLLDVSSMTIYRWERGGHTPNASFRGRLCQLFQVSAADLGWTEQAREEGPSSERFTFLLDPALPVSKTVPIGQQVLLHTLTRSSAQILGVTGLPGSGKTLLAQTFATQPEIRRQVNGVLWASVGQHPDPLRHLRRWLVLLGSQVVPERLEEAQDQLRLLLQGRQLLLILDDVWKVHDLRPYQAGLSCRLLVTTRLPAVAHSVCDRVVHPRHLTEQQAFHLLIHHLPTLLVREHRQVLHALSQHMGFLPAALEQIGRALRREARAFSPRRWQETLTSLFQPSTYLHLQLSPDASSLATSFARSLRWVSPSVRYAFQVLATSFPAAPATFSESQVSDLFHRTRLSLRDLDQLVDVGLLSGSGQQGYQLHPVIAAYARTLAQEPPVEMN